MGTASSWSIPLAKGSIRNLALYAVLGALTFGAKFAMSGLPNIEPVSLMVMLFAVVFGAQAVYPIGVYIAMEFLVYGPGLWNLCYLYIWFVLAAAAYLLRKMESALGWAVLSGGFGLAFGLLCAPVDMVVGGAAYALGKVVTGIPFDIAHCVGNFVIALTLFSPLRKRMEMLARKRIDN